MDIVIYFEGFKISANNCIFNREKTDTCVDGDLKLQSPVSNMMWKVYW